ncbi:MAG: VWA domain-containing protein [Vicinamibacterales bacterium]
MTGLRPLLAALAGAVALGPAAPSATSQTPPQRPVFRAAADLVELAVTVFDKDGRPVTDLTREDFEVREDDAPQTLEQFSFVDLRPARNPESGGNRGGSAEPVEAFVPVDVGTNEAVGEGRVYVIVLDGLHVSPLRSTVVRRLVREFVAEHLTPRDLVAVLTLGSASAAGRHEFTHDQAKVLASVDEFVGSKSQSATLNKMVSSFRAANDGPADDFEAGVKANDARLLFETLRQVCAALGDSASRRRAVVLFSEGIELDMTDLIGADSRTTGFGAIPTHTASRYAEDLLRAQQALYDAARRSNVALYTVDPRGTTTGEDDLMQAFGSSPAGVDIQQEVQRSQGTLRTFAQQTGGVAVVNTTNFSRGFDAIVQSNSTYYLLGYAPTNAQRDGTFRKIRVRVNRPGVTVSAREGYFATPDAPPADAPPGAGDRTPAGGDRPVVADGAGRPLSDRLGALLASALPARGLGLRVSGGIVGWQDERATVGLVIELDTADLAFAEADGVIENDLELAFQVVDDQGRVPAGNGARAHLRLPAAERAAIGSGLRYVAEVTLPPGRYQVRAAATERVGGSGGSAWLDVDTHARDRSAAGAVLLVRLDGAPLPTTGQAPAMLALAGAPPTAAREFPLGSRVAVVMASEAGGPAGDWTATVLDATGAARATPPVRAVPPAGPAAAAGIRLDVATAALGPGVFDLVLRRANGSAAERHLRFRVRPPGLPSPGAEAAALPAREPRR